MAREGIYVGSKEIIQRYVGTRLVWEKILFPFYTQTQVIYKRSSPFQIYFKYISIHTVVLTVHLLNGLRLTAMSLQLQTL